jgi:hypothetical protein
MTTALKPSLWEPNDRVAPWTMTDVGDTMTFCTEVWVYRVWWGVCRVVHDVDERMSSEGGLVVHWGIN